MWADFHSIKEGDTEVEGAKVMQLIRNNGKGASSVV